MHSQLRLLHCLGSALEIAPAFAGLLTELLAWVRGGIRWQGFRRPLQAQHRCPADYGTVSGVAPTPGSLKLTSSSAGKYHSGLRRRTGLFRHDLTFTGP